MPISLAASRVLIVDDNEFNRKSLALMIRRAGLTQIEVAENGVEGLRKVESFRPDLVLLDVSMPVMDGLEMCRRLASG
ncbi:response regulator [Azospirillum argentinense]|uniref:response regulator n=1 Tax=Azospirillum argentinense TaxID=2970906 RepID=UPI001FFFDB4A|nr:response regulator [Azospirillum argentinense]